MFTKGTDVTDDRCLYQYQSVS